MNFFLFMFWFPPRSNPDFVLALKDRFFDNALRLGLDIDVILKSAQRPKNLLTIVDAQIFLLTTCRLVNGLNMDWVVFDGDVEPKTLHRACWAA